jgi:hypothetical protein
MQTVITSITAARHSTDLKPVSFSHTLPPERKKISTYNFIVINLTPYLLTWRIWWAPNNARKWHMGFNWAFKGLIFLIHGCTIYWNGLEVHRCMGGPEMDSSGSGFCHVVGSCGHGNEPSTSKKRSGRISRQSEENFLFSKNDCAPCSKLLL